MCIFCKPDPDLILLESSHSYLLANYYPLCPICLMAIPKRHVESITNLSSEESADLLTILALATNNIKTRFNPEGINIFLNEGEIAGQSVPHLHFHLVARNSGDGLENFKRNGEKTVITAEELQAVKNIF